MNLLIQRDTYTDTSTTGELLVDNAFLCYTLEPRKDTSNGKPYAIPAGAYNAQLLMSTRFGELTPHILNVPGFTAIEIHPGNYPQDTEGCTVVGLYRGTDYVAESRAAFNALVKLLPASGIFTVTYTG